MAARPQITARDIVSLLEAKHASDFGMSEAKTGPTETGVLKLDYWAMTLSWANFRAIGYEVKVSRSDFLRDDKWRGYLPYCTEFYFVAPPKLISADELPPEAGLLELAKTGTRFYTRKKAPTRGIQIHPDILIYALMWRTGRAYDDKGALLEEFRKADVNAIAIGQSLGSKLAKALSEAKWTLHHERRQIERDRADLEALEGKLAAKREELREIQRLVREAGSLDSLSREVERFRRTIEAVRSVEAVA